MDLSGSAGCPYTPEQMFTNTHNCILKSQFFPDASTRELKRKTSIEKAWPNFKKYQQNQGTIVKSTYNVANSANQELLQSQYDFRQLSSEMIDNLRKEFYDALTPGNSTPITSNQECHLTQHQAHQNQLTDNTNLMSIIQDLKKKRKR